MLTVIKEDYFVALMIVLVLINIFSYSLMALDKHRAKRGKWRIPEKSLFLAAFFFGGVGAWFGMESLHHKTGHWYFKWFFSLFMMLQVLGFGYFLGAA